MTKWAVDTADGKKIIVTAEFEDVFSHPELAYTSISDVRQATEEDEVEVFIAELLRQDGLAG